MQTTRRSFVQLLGVTGASALVGCESATDALARLVESGAEAVLAWVHHSFWTVCS